MAHIRLVPAQKLSSKSLRAQDYIVTERSAARALLREWRKSNPRLSLLNPRDPVFKDLEDRITRLLEKERSA